LVVHHFIPRHSWKAGTYEPLNLVILCGKCHFELHQKQNPNIVARIIEKRGKKWLNKLNHLYQKTKKNVSYYGEKWLQTQINQMKQKSQQLDKEANHRL
jgi:5-methylcytosine-specific restriction endonuclease McrA